MSRHSEAAKRYVSLVRAPSDRVATWMDVAKAYDDGARTALRNQRRAISNSRVRRPRCSVCGFTESSGIHTEHLVGKAMPFSKAEYHSFVPPKAGEQ